MGVRILCLLIGYAFGLFQTSYIIGRIHGIDIRNYGSGNAGSTNAMRTMGRRAGLLTFFGDCLKCVFAVLLTQALFGKSHEDILPLLKLYTSAGVILGHNFPFYLQFRGGKGIAATAGMVMTLDPVLSVLGWAAFIVTFVLTGYVSLGSLVVYTGLVIETIVLGQAGHFHLSGSALLEMYILTIALAVMAFWRHRENIARLKSGTERRSHMFEGLRKKIWRRGQS